MESRESGESGESSSGKAIVNIEKQDVQFQRSNKKIKRRIESVNVEWTEEQAMEEDFPSPGFETRKSGPNWAEKAGGKSFVDTVVGSNEKGDIVQYINPFWEDDKSEGDLLHDPAPLEQDPKCPVILLTAEEKNRIRRPWKDAIIVKVYDRSVGFMYLKRSLVQKWKPKGDFDMIDIGNEYYIIRSRNKEDLHHAMISGPWLIGDNYLTIQKCRPNFIADEEPIHLLAAWLRIPNLSMEYFDTGILNLIGTKLGKVLIDKTTTAVERGRFTRLC